MYIIIACYTLHEYTVHTPKKEEAWKFNASEYTRCVALCIAIEDPDFL